MSKTWRAVLAIIFVLAVVGGISVFILTNNKNTKSADAVPSPAPANTANTNVDDDYELPEEYAIEEALVAKNKWNANNITIKIQENDGTYAKGMVNSATPGAGGGLWFAKRVGENWVIVWDGNGIVTCAALEKYSDFPAKLIPQCFDSTTNKMVSR
jgi:hypothetical protein